MIGRTFAIGLTEGKVVGIKTIIITEKVVKGPILNREEL